MNNIEILEELIKYWKDLIKITEVDSPIYTWIKDDKIEEKTLALENLIQKNKELKEETTENQDYIKYLQKKLTNAIEIKYIHQDYILKSKVKEKIEELKNEKDKYFEKQVIQGRIDLLEKLLEEKKEK